MFIQKSFLKKYYRVLFLLMVFVSASYCGIIDNEKDDYEIQSIACKKLEMSKMNDQLCERNMYFHWKVFCRYECSDNGDLRTSVCRPNQIELKEHPLCDELYCVLKKEGTPQPTQAPPPTSEPTI